MELAYEAEVRKQTVAELIEGLTLVPDAFVVELLQTAEECRADADKLIADRATGWSLARMPAIDLLVMRQAVAEMMKLDTPTGVILAEAVELVSRYSTDESSRFVNGVLSAIARDLRPASN